MSGSPCFLIHVIRAIRGRIPPHPHPSNNPWFNLHYSNDPWSRVSLVRMVGLRLYRVAVPLKKAVKHASFERSVSENLVVRAELSDGSVGFGGGGPRSYVTGCRVRRGGPAVLRHRGDGRDGLRAAVAAQLGRAGRETG